MPYGSCRVDPVGQLAVAVAVFRLLLQLICQQGLHVHQKQTYVEGLRSGCLAKAREALPPEHTS